MLIAFLLLTSTGAIHFRGDGGFSLFYFNVVWSYFYFGSWLHIQSHTTRERPEENVDMAFSLSFMPGLLGFPLFILYKQPHRTIYV